MKLKSENLKMSQNTQSTMTSTKNGFVVPLFTTIGETRVKLLGFLVVKCLVRP